MKFYAQDSISGTSNIPPGNARALGASRHCADGSCAEQPDGGSKQHAHCIDSSRHGRGNSESNRG